ncbi:hypothetical protein FRB96_007182 [Tulasnella sp. 330]|nr:hypothetical protein FRB96_007182 [Tulasnella sp. 330]
MAVESHHLHHQATASSSGGNVSAPRKSKSRSPASIPRSPKAASSSGYPTPSTTAQASSSAQHYFPPHHAAAQHHSHPLQHVQHQRHQHQHQHQEHPPAIDHPTDGSPLEESVLSNPAYKAYADLIAHGGLPPTNSQPTPETSQGSPMVPHDNQPGQAQQRQQRDDQDDQDEQQHQNQLRDSSSQQMLQQVSTPPGGVMPFPTPGSVPVAYFAGPGGSIIAIPQLKTKRRQVKNACTNCQKACKKCDEVRPCTRCVKYDLASECVDSQRKERKKGVKRGPYKKREHKTEEEESQNQMTAAAAASAAAQISILTPDNAAALQAMGGIIYSYAPVHNSASGSGQNQHQIVSGSSGGGGGESSNSVAGPSPSIPQDGSSHMSASVPPPGGTAASYTFHPQFYLAPNNPQDGGVAHGGPSQGQHSQDSSSQQHQQHAQYYATIAAAYFGGSGAVPGASSTVGPGVSMLIPSMSSVPMTANNGGEGNSGAPSSSAPQNQQPMFQMHMSPSTMAAQAAADDPIERHHPHPQPQRYPQQIMVNHQSMMMVAQQQQHQSPQSGPSGRALTPGKKVKGEKRKREKGDDVNSQGLGQQSDGSGGSSEEQRQAVRPRQTVSVE